VLLEFTIKGRVLDKQRMENGSFLREDYFERLLAEIHEIRLSERKFYHRYLRYSNRLHVLNRFNV